MVKVVDTVQICRRWNENREEIIFGESDDVIRDENLWIS